MITIDTSEAYGIIVAVIVLYICYRRDSDQLDK